MNTNELVAYVRSNCLDNLVDGYAEMFTKHSTKQFTDASMRELAVAWQAATPEMQVSMKAFMRLGSQNTAATILALMDEDCGIDGLDLSLIAKQPDGSQYSLSRDLLNVFWEQEESAGRVNRR